jgi:predicted peptidase
MIIKSKDSTDLKALPPDTGGKHSRYILGETKSPYGFYVYIPAGYEQSPGDYPLLIFLHGDGERGNSAENIKTFDYVLFHGPPHLIKNGEWNPPFPMIVASPQCHDKYWQVKKLDEFIRYITEHYRVNQSRIYLTGLSLGGDAIYSYLSETGDRSLIAAAVIISGVGDAALARQIKVPVWIQNALEMKESLRNAPEVKLSVYPDEWHLVWYQTYDSTGVGKTSGKYDPFDTSIYDWLFTYSLSGE